MSTRKKDNVSSSTAVLYRKKLGPILKGHRELHEIPRRKVQNKLLKLLDQREQKGESGWVEFRDLVDSKKGGSLAELEDRGLAQATIRLPDIRILAEAYGIPGLLLDPARSKPVKTILSSFEISDFLEINQKNIPLYGSRTKYRFPPTQIDGSEKVSIVYLDLEATEPELWYDPSHSDSHDHPGEEFVFSEEGTIEMRFDDTGLRCCLETNSFIHFDSRSRHSACNPGSKKARCFIIRFYEREIAPFPDNNGVVTAKRLRRKPAEATTREKVIAEELTNSLNSQGYREVIDRRGFGRFLQLLCSKSIRGDGNSLSLSELAKRAKDEGYSFNRSKLDRIHHGRAPVYENELKQLAKIYEIEPMALYNFLLPTFKPAIAVHEKDYKDEIVAEFLPSGVKYKLPPRRLAGSNMMVALLSIDPNCATKPNHHPGQELIKPLRGKVAIEFVDSRVKIKKGGYAHYRSHLNHRAVNMGKEPATMLCIRFMG
jgi:quercetin dioxygenase-like cupin family protein